MDLVGWFCISCMFPSCYLIYFTQLVSQSVLHFLHVSILLPYIFYSVSWSVSQSVSHAFLACFHLVALYILLSSREWPGITSALRALLCYLLRVICSFAGTYSIKYCVHFTKVYPKVSGLAAWSENCKWYSSLH
jgi:hypothetical protein